MAITNHERVDKALELLRAGLASFVEREFQAQHGKYWITTVTAARRVVLVGNKISPGNPVTKPDGTVVRTLWGELAWQLGGKPAFNRIKAVDENTTSPGDVLRELF